MYITSECFCICIRLRSYYHFLYQAVSFDCTYYRKMNVTPKKLFSFLLDSFHGQQSFFKPAFTLINRSLSNFCQVYFFYTVLASSFERVVFFSLSAEIYFSDFPRKFSKCEVVWKIVGVKSIFVEASHRLFRLHQGRNFFEDTFSTLLTAECWFCIFTPKKKKGIFSRGVERASSVAYFSFYFCVRLLYILA